MLGNSVMVEFREVCQHCRKQIIDYVSWKVARETSEAHFKQEFFTLFLQSKHALELCNEILAHPEMLPNEVESWVC